jgi:hypothetical protein
MRVKRTIVYGLDSACYVIDGLPSWTYWLIIRWLGCPNGLSALAARLDKRWELGLYRPVEHWVDI